MAWRQILARRETHPARFALARGSLTPSGPIVAPVAIAETGAGEPAPAERNSGDTTPGSAGETGVTFRWKDYRIEGPGRYKTMPLATNEFIRRFRMHVLPKGLHRIRHYGLFANGNRP